MEGDRSEGAGAAAGGGAGRGGVLRWSPKTFTAEDAEVAEKGKYPLVECTDAVISAAIEVHRTLGPGLLESIYLRALSQELRLRGMAHGLHVQVPVQYKGVQLGAPLQIDMLANDCVVVEVKAVQALEDVHRAQLLTYLRLTGLEVGLLINFNVPVLRQGIKRVANSTKTSLSSAPSASSAPLR